VRQKLQAVIARGVTGVDKLLRPELIDLCEKMLDYTALRHKVIANNIANVNTPGFRRSDVRFAEELERVLHDKGLAGAKKLRFRVTEPNTTAFRSDGNNVNIDTEMAALAENAILYQVYAQLLAGRFRQIDEILKEA
jgi:flagellar basal-body rod protein FlgB